VMSTMNPRRYRLSPSTRSTQARELLTSACGAPRCCLAKVLMHSRLLLEELGTTVSAMPTRALLPTRTQR
jgi:hypothetical protein